MNILSCALLNLYPPLRNKPNNPFANYKALGVFILSNLLVLSLFRLGLSLWQAERVFADLAWWQIAVGGLRVDLSTIGYLAAIPFLLLVVNRIFNLRLVSQLIALWFIIASALLLFFELLTPTFILEYDLRPNRLFWEYLIYPKEVSHMLLSGYKIELVVVTLALAGYGWGLCKYYHQYSNLYQHNHHDNLNYNPSTKTNAFKAVEVIYTLLILIGLFAAIRGTVSHRPLNPALVSFSNDHLLNDLSLNSLYSAAVAAKQMRSERSSMDTYGAMDPQQLVSIMKNASNRLPSQYINNEQILWQPQIATQTLPTGAKPKNIVIILQESLGARYVGGLGGRPLTPNLDKIMLEGWHFTQLYATGTRSVRGIEAVTTGFFPTVARSIVKLDKSQRQFFSLPYYLKQQGYHTQFIYGGESHFDNMRGFFLGNGVEQIVDINDFTKIDFNGSWGASDGDLFDQADRELTQLAQTSQPFFSLIFTSSNHSPFEFPDNKIDLFEQPKQTRNNAAKYADYALGQFITTAKQANYWHNSIFLIVADHDSRVSGAQLVPMDHFRIPGVLLGDSITPYADNQLTSQIDLPVTLLSLAGVSGNHPMMGLDLTQPTVNKRRAIMQYDNNFAFVKEDKMIVFQPEQPVAVFNLAMEQLQSDSVTATLLDEAKAHALLGSMAYENNWYKVN